MSEAKPQVGEIEKL